MQYSMGDIWPVVLSIFFALVWLIRLEAKVLYLENARSVFNDKLDSMQNKLIEIGESLARMEGKIESKTFHE